MCIFIQALTVVYSDCTVVYADVYAYIVYHVSLVICIALALLQALPLQCT